MKKQLIRKSGFTLIELVTAILIMSIVTVMAGTGLVQIAKGYLLAKKSTVAVEQAQIAMTRMAKELSGIETISTESSSPSLKYTRGETSHTLAWSGADQPLTLDGDTLIDKVQSFSLAYYDYNYATRTYTPLSYSQTTGMIEVTFQIKTYDEIPLTFVQRAAI